MPRITPTQHAIKVDINDDRPGMTKGEIDRYLEESKGGFNTDELGAAFDLVKDPENWKNSIDAVIDAEKRDVVDRAIPFYTGTEAFFEDVTGQPGKLRVTAAGYYAGPCN